jgi:hypothetical protein
VIAEPAVTLAGVIVSAACCCCCALSHEQLLFQMSKRCYQGNVELSKLASKGHAFGATHQHQRVPGAVSHVARREPYDLLLLALRRARVVS